MDILVLAIGSVIWGGALAGVAIVLQASMRISGAARQALWRIVASLVLAPWIIAPLADWADIGLPASAPIVEQAAIAEPVTIVADEPSVAPVISAIEPLVPETPIPWQAILIAVIAAGWLWRVVAARIAQASLSRIVARASDAGDGLARQSLESWSRRLRFQKAPRLLIVKEGLSPFSFGAIRPVICLPQGLDRKLGAEALDLVVGHECLHVARGDGWLRPVERLVADLIWFNPFAWRIRRELDVARELACDEAVLKHAQSHRAYARTLRNVAGITAGLDFAVPAASMSLAGSPRSLMLRVTRALSGSKSKPARAALFGVAVVALAGVPVACMQGVAAAPRVAAKPVAIENLKLAAALDEPLVPQTPQQPPSSIAPARMIEAPQAQPLAGRVLRLSGNTQPVIDGKARLTSGYGFLPDPFTGRTAFHPGVDLAAYYDAPIHAPVDGIVTFSGVKGAYGRVVELDVGEGAKMLFGHLGTIKVEADAKVEAGDVLGTMGSTGRSTGPHLHFEYYLNGKAYDPLTIKNLKFATSLDEPQVPRAQTIPEPAIPAPAESAPSAPRAPAVAAPAPEQPAPLPPQTPAVPAPALERPVPLPTPAPPAPPEARVTDQADRRTELVELDSKRVDRMQLRYDFDGNWVVDNQNIVYRDTSRDYYLVTLKESCEQLDIRSLSYRFYPSWSRELRANRSYEVRPEAGARCDVVRIERIDDARANALRAASQRRAW